MEIEELKIHSSMMTDFNQIEIISLAIVHISNNFELPVLFFGEESYYFLDLPN